MDFKRLISWFLGSLNYLFLFVFNSCIHQIEPQLVGNPSEIILVNSFLYADSIPEIWIKKGKNKLGNDWQNLVDAKVSIQKINPKNGFSVERIPLYFSDSIYTNSSPLASGFEYQLLVETIDGKTLKASTRIPNPVKIDTLIRSDGPSMKFEFVEGVVNIDRVTFRPNREGPNNFETKYFSK